MLALAPLSRHMAETEHLGSRGAKPGGAAVRVSWQEGARPATPAPDAAWPRQEALARPKTAPAHTRSAGHAGPSKLVLQERQYGRPSLFDKEVKGTAHAYLGACRTRERSSSLRDAWWCACTCVSPPP